MLTNADAGREQLASVGIGLREIVEHELAMVSAHIVGRERNGRQNPRAAKGEVARQDDVHVHLDDLGEPGCAPVRFRLALQPPGARDRDAQCSQPFTKMRGFSLLAGAQPHRSPKRVFENAHPQAAVTPMVIERVEKNHVLRHRTGAVVARDGRGERRQIRIGDHRICDLV